ncbi:SIR2 family NAD-dependent protein deacylase [Longimicrobium terrae]|uniref:NAD-dependent protein deacylase n=1 Tax=Longimicrobium terrae TaxID=1639882 RepID=A0A841H774_9BACT|nr:NAD-dependent deacylase [Longimicrobium terrae]MBB4638278.1 NAD-dependent deacetylase [Longimicrobium terrae]MBB6073752.1 NAD-dependent deacetylase [Longimicrobium terrae]NNC30246.1 NAD-dependent deacylase [Longimicrobium terrae]
MTPEGLARAARIVADSGLLVVSSGAGMSRESGIPTFRDAMEGLWANFDPQELATEEGFRANPRRVWSWYAWRRDRVMQARPNPGHFAVAELAGIVPELVVVTQNVDGLHAAAGSRDVVEVHGSIRRVRCLDRGHVFSGELPVYAECEEQDPPPCPVCGSPLRPDVVWFGEMLPVDAVERAWSLAGRCDTMLLIGTSGTVWPAAELPLVARRAGARIIEVNPHRSELTHTADVFLQGPAGEVLPALLAEVRRLLAASTSTS